MNFRRRYYADPVHPSELKRRIRIHERERSAHDRKRDFLRMLEAFDAENARFPLDKELETDGQAELRSPATPIILKPREVVMRTKMVPILPCYGYKLPPRDPWRVMYVGGRPFEGVLSWIAGKPDRAEGERVDISTVRMADGNPIDDEQDAGVSVVNMVLGRASNEQNAAISILSIGESQVGHKEEQKGTSIVCMVNGSQSDDEEVRGISILQGGEDQMGDEDGDISMVYVVESQMDEEENSVHEFTFC